MELDPVWLKPREEIPKRRGLIGALRKETNLKCLILTCLIYGCVLAIVWCRVTRVTKIDIDFNAFPITSTRQTSPCDDGYIYIPSAFVVMLYLLYLIECWHCATWVQLRFEKTDVNRAYQIVEEMRHSQPLVWWKAVCYHYVRRTREIARIHNGDSYLATQVYYERVNSNLATGCLYFGYCGMRDISPELVNLEKHAATKIRLSKGFLFANLAAAQEFEEQRSTFFQDQERFDDYMEMKEGLDLTPTASYGDFKENLISWSSPDNLPWFARSTVFWVANLLLLSWPLRLILELNTAHVHYQVTKLFGSNYVTPRSPQNRVVPSPGNYTGRHAQNRGGHQLRATLYSSIERVATDSPSNQSRNRGTPNPSISTSSNSEETQPVLLSRGDFCMEKAEKDANVKDQSQITNSTDHSYFHFRNSNFSFHRNPLQFFRHNRNRLVRSVTLLMTKGERDEFGVNFNNCKYLDILKDINEESIGSEDDLLVRGVTRNSRDSPSIRNSDSNSGLAPTYSQALLLMEPNIPNRISITSHNNRISTCMHTTDDGSTSSPSTNRDINTNTLLEDNEEDRGNSNLDVCSLCVLDGDGNENRNSADQSRSEFGNLTIMTTELGVESRNSQSNFGIDGNSGEDVSPTGAADVGSDFSTRITSRGRSDLGDSVNSIRSRSLALDNVAPRTMSEVPVDLTQPVVLTVPDDPRSSTTSSGGPSTSTDSPPSYEEALRTSRPVFLPTWARIRRCFTERDIHSRLSSSSFWLNYNSTEDNSEPAATSQV